MATMTFHTNDCEMAQIDASFNCTCGATPQPIREDQLVSELRARANARHSGLEPSPTALLCAQAADQITALERYAALGRACESNGLGWYGDDGEMRFQPPAEVIEEHAQAPLYARIETLRKALEPFVQGYSHTELFLRSGQRMHPDGQRLYRDDVERASRALNPAE